MKFRHTNFMRLIYATLLALPFVAILSRVIYVQSNKNAYQSAEITQTTYSRTPKYKQGDINNGLERDKIYHLEMDEVLLPDFFDTQTNRLSFVVLNGKFTYITSNGYYLDEWGNEDDDNYFEYNFHYEDNLSTLEIAFDNSGNYLYIINEVDEISFNGDILITDYYDNYAFDFSYFSNTTYQDYDYIEVESTTLDNVFEYSVNKFIENNNFGKINLFQWTTNLFFDSNDVNNMYVGFINWYFNYTLLVSATYILFLVLMWFINYARRLLERGMNYDW